MVTSYIDTTEVILSDWRDTGAGTTENLKVGDWQSLTAVARQLLRITSIASMQHMTIYIKCIIPCNTMPSPRTSVGPLSRTEKNPQ